MTKDIKDYLHLYIGCEAQFTGYHQQWTGINNAFTLMGVNDEEFTCRLILRQLSDMTEEEANQFLFNHDFKYQWINCIRVECYEVQYEFCYSTSKRVRRDSLRFDELGPKDFIWLLSKGFDLFNLIPEGLAIDKTTLKQKA